MITLFGEQITKQFLSESLGLWDNYIFAMAPLGILTAVVSVIRICGTSSLKAFIGRAQEGPGDAELELLSCTSQTTAELWNDGGIARVFGKPQILEIATSDPEVSRFESTLRDGPMDYTAGLFFVGQGDEGNPWQRVSSGGIETQPLVDESSPGLMRPNLSINKGIKQRHPLWFWAAAGLGTFLQVGKSSLFIQKLVENQPCHRCRSVRLSDSIRLSDTLQEEWKGS